VEEEEEEEEEESFRSYDSVRVRVTPGPPAVPSGSTPYLPVDVISGAGGGGREGESARFNRNFP
jgi:hypothetical protein